jgi:hypothetical protein
VSFSSTFTTPSFPRRRESLFSVPQNADARFRGHDGLSYYSTKKQRFE